MYFIYCMTKKGQETKKKKEGDILSTKMKLYIYTNRLSKENLGKGGRVYFWNRSQETWPSTTSSGDAASLLL